MALLLQLRSLDADGKDLRSVALLERKRRLVRIIPRVGSRLLIWITLGSAGRDLFDAVCANDLEGIVGKWADGTYQQERREYSQIRDRHELFDARSPRGIRSRPRAVSPALVRA